MSQEAQLELDKIKLQDITNYFNQVRENTTAQLDRILHWLETYHTIPITRRLEIIEEIQANLYMMNRENNRIISGDNVL